MNKVLKYTLVASFSLVVLANAVAAMQAYRFTHFASGGQHIRQDGLSTMQKLQLLVTGVNIPRPENRDFPRRPFTVVKIRSNVELGCWYIQPPVPAKGTIIIFHGYIGCKSALINRAEPFLQAGYNCLLVDFMGSGGSGGNSTTIGYKEAQEVADCYSYIQQRGEGHIYLYGSSMGAVAIMKAMHDTPIKPSAIILECPFATMYETVAIRFRNLGVPTFPMARLLMFWGGVENGFPAAAHNPVSYATGVHCPVLLQYGALDKLVAKDETDRIYANLNKPKRLIVYPLAGHDNYYKDYGKEWAANMVGFIGQYR